MNSDKLNTLVESYAVRSPKLTRADLCTFGQHPAQSDLQPPARSAALKYALNFIYKKCSNK